MATVRKPDTAAPELRRLTYLPADLRAQGYDPGEYRRLREAALDGRFPAIQRHGYWYFDPRDLETIVMAMRLDRLTAPAA